MKKKFSLKKIVILIAILAAAATGAYFMFLAPLEVSGVKLETGLFEDSFTEKGHYTGGGEINCISQVSGSVVSVEVSKNDTVKAGDVLVRVSTSKYESEKRQHQANISSLRSAGSAGQKAANNAKTEYESNKKLYDEGFISKSVLDESQENYTKAKSELSGQQQQIAAENADIAYLDELIEKCTIRATCDGVVTDLPAANMTALEEGDIAAVIKGNSRSRVEVDVLTSEEPYLSVGDEVALTMNLKAGTREYKGKISEIYGYSEKMISALGVDEYRVKVFVDLEGGEDLKNGYELTAKFSIYKNPEALAVPNSAIFHSNGKDLVFVVKGGKAALQEITIGHRGATMSEVTEGLSQGDVVITDTNVEGLEDGVRVAI